MNRIFCDTVRLVGPPSIGIVGEGGRVPPAQFQEGEVVETDAIGERPEGGSKRSLIVGGFELVEEVVEMNLYCFVLRASARNTLWFPLRHVNAARRRHCVSIRNRADGS